MNKKTLSLAGLFILFSQVCIAGELIYSVKEYAKHGYVTLDLEKNMDDPDGHLKLLHLWPVKLLQAGRMNYA